MSARRRWTIQEDTVLKERYGPDGAESVARQLGRTPMAVATRANGLGLNVDPTRVIWTTALDEVLVLLNPVGTARMIADLLGCSPSAVYQRCHALGLVKPEGWASEARRMDAARRTRFTPEVCEAIRKRYPTELGSDLARELGLKTSALWKWARAHGVEKDPEWVRATAKERSSRPGHPMQSFQFKKGAVPANKGLKGVCNPGSVATQFKKGQRGTTFMEVGSLRVNADGYLDKKVQATGYPPDDWKPVHRLVWIEAHGPVPAGHVVRFKDGMKTNVLERISLDRLECISLAENARRNAWHAKASPEMRRLIGTRIAMTRAIKKHSKRLEGEANG